MRGTENKDSDHSARTKIWSGALESDLSNSQIILCTDEWYSNSNLQRFTMQSFGSRETGA